MVAQKLILGYGSKVLVQLIQIAASIVVARIAGPTVLGTVAFGLAFVSMFEFVADLGIGSAHVKLVSEGQDVGKCISTFAALKFFNTLLFLFVVLGIFLLQKYVFSVQFESAVHERVIIIILATVSVNQILNIPIRTFAARTEQAKQSIPEFARTFIYQILRVLIVLLGFRAVALAFGNLISTLAVVPLVFYLFKDYPRAGFDKELALRYIKISLPFLAMGMATNVIYYLDKVGLQYFTSSEQVGYYTAGYRIGGMVLLVAHSVGLLFFPLFSKAASDGDHQYIGRTIIKFERFSFLFVMPVVILLSLYSDVIVKVLLGQQYLPSVPIMAIINFAMFFMVLSVPYGSVLTGMGFFKLSAILNVLNLVFFAILLYFLPNPRYLNLNAVGMALVVFMSKLFIGAAYRVFAKKKCAPIDLKENLKFLVFGIVNFLVARYVYVEISRLHDFRFKIIFAPLFLVATYAVLLLLGWIGKSDKDNLKKLINIKKLGSYVKKEVKGD